jgi:hypothetical protein
MYGNVAKGGGRGPHTFGGLPRVLESLMGSAAWLSAFTESRLMLKYTHKFIVRN